MAIRVELELADGNFTSRLIHAGETVEQFNRNVARSYPHLQKMAESGDLVYRSIGRADDTTRRFVVGLRDVAVAGAAITYVFSQIRRVTSGFVGDIVRVNAEVERMTKLMAGMSKAADPMKDAIRQVADMRKMAMEMPFSINMMQNSIVKLTAVDLKPMEGSFRQLADGVAAFGGTDEQLYRITLGMQQMVAKGVIQMEELRQQLGEHMPRAAELMARAMGVSYGQLMKAIAAGTVDARPALAKMLAELERVYGGSAQRMMETYRGQLTRTTTLMQNLALRVGGEGNSGFFGVLKDQLEDLNRFLAGGVATKLADMFGDSLSSGVRILRSIIDTVVEFREEIQRAGLALVVAFGASAMVGWMNRFMTFIQTSSAGIGMFRAQLALASTEIQGIKNLMTIGAAGQAASGLALFGTGATSQLRNSTSAFGAFAGKLKIVGTILPVIASGFMMVAPWLPLIGLGIYAVAEYFDLFGSKAREAWEEMETFGVVSMEQAERGREFINEMIRQREELERKDAIRPFGKANPNIENAIAELDRKIAEARVKLPEFIAQGREADAKKAADAAMTEIRRESEGLQRAYDERANFQVKAYEEARARMIANGQSVSRLEETHQLNRRRAEIKFYDDKIEILQRHIDRERQMLMNADEATQHISQARLEELVKEQTRLLEVKDQVRRSTMGIDTRQDDDDLDKLLERGAKHLERLKGDVSGLEAALAGATNEAGELVYHLESGKYGDPSDERVATLIRQLKDAQTEADILNEMLDGRSKFERDASTLALKLQEEIFDLQHKGIGDVDKFLLKVKEGFYAGIGPGKSRITQMIEGMRTSMGETSDATATLAETLKDKLFGSDMMSAGNNLVSLIERLRGSLTGVGSAVGAIPAGPMSRPGSGASSVSSAPVSSDTMELIKSFEGFRSTPYWDVNAYRAGFGSDTVTLSDGSIQKVVQGMTVSRADADRDLARRIGEFQGGIISSVGLDNWSQMTQEMRAALTSIAYNYGQLPSSVEKAVRTGSTEKVVEAIRGLAGHNGGINAGRRNDEADLVARGGSGSPSPIYKEDSQIPVSSLGLGSAEMEQMVILLQQLQQQANKLRADNGLKEFGLDMQREMAEAGEQTDGLGKRLSNLHKLIREGKFGPDTNVESARYAEMIALAQQWDAQEEALAEKKKARTALDTAQQKKETDELHLKQRQADALARLEDPLEQKRSAGMRTLIRQWDEYLEKVRAVYGAESVEFEQAQADKEIALRESRNVEILENAATLEQKNRDLRRSFMTERQARQEALNFEIQRLQRELAEFQGTAEERLLIEGKIQQQIGLLRQQAGASGPLAQQMRQWSDFGQNLEQAMTGWIGNISDAFTNFITGGKVDFREMINSMIRDLTRLAMNKLISGMFGMGGGKGGMKGAGGAKAKGGGLGAMFGIAHTGGIIGALGQGKVANSMVFAGAPRYHVGGIIGDMGLSKDEVPIIGRRGEGVFTEEQMAAMGNVGGNYQKIEINAPVSVNANGGEPAQNRDLAEQVGAQVTKSIRGIVAQELRQQLRPGNMLNR